MIESRKFTEALLALKEGCTIMDNVLNFKYKMESHNYETKTKHGETGGVKTQIQKYHKGDIVNYDYNFTIDDIMSNSWCIIDNESKFLKAFFTQTMDSMIDISTPSLDPKSFENLEQIINELAKNKSYMPIVIVSEKITWNGESKLADELFEKWQYFAEDSKDVFVFHGEGLETLIKVGDNIDCDLTKLVNS